MSVSRVCRVWLIAVFCYALSFSQFSTTYAANDLVRIETVKKAGSDTIIATNNSRMPVMVTLQLSSSSNLASSRNWPIQVLLAGGQSMELVDVSAANRQFAYTLYSNSQVVQGDPRARHDAGVSYRIPFLADQAFQILQSADGPLFTHTTVATRYAVDINMPVGTTVVAARAGMVVEVVRQFADNGKAEAEFFDKANYVRVLHDDGSWADYVHLMQNSTQVQPGQRVDIGNVLALSGNSGFSTTPHLHFHVQVNQNGTIISLPFRFRNAHDGVFTPLYKTWLIPDPKNLTVSRTKTKKTLRECLPNGKPIDDTVIRCLSS